MNDLRFARRELWLAVLGLAAGVALPSLAFAIGNEAGKPGYALYSLPLALIIMAFGVYHVRIAIDIINDIRADYRERLTLQAYQRYMQRQRLDVTLEGRADNVERQRRADVRQTVIWWTGGGAETTLAALRREYPRMANHQAVWEEAKALVVDMRIGREIERGSGTGVVVQRVGYNDISRLLEERGY